jgi:hypothetical protein
MRAGLTNAVDSADSVDLMGVNDGTINKETTLI